VVAGVRLICDHHLGHLSVIAVASQRDACIVVGVNRLAEVDRVLQFLSQDLAARVPRHLQQEEARVALG